MRQESEIVPGTSCMNHWLVRAGGAKLWLLMTHRSKVTAAQKRTIRNVNNAHDDQQPA